MDHRTAPGLKGTGDDTLCTIIRAPGDRAFTTTGLLGWSGVLRKRPLFKVGDA